MVLDRAWALGQVGLGPNTALPLIASVPLAKSYHLHEHPFAHLETDGHFSFKDLRQTVNDTSHAKHPSGLRVQRTHWTNINSAPLGPYGQSKARRPHCPPLPHSKAHTLLPILASSYRSFLPTHVLHLLLCSHLFPLSLQQFHLHSLCLQPPEEHLQGDSVSRAGLGLGAEAGHEAQRVASPAGEPQCHSGCASGWHTGLARVLLRMEHGRVCERGHKLKTARSGRGHSSGTSQGREELGQHRDPCGKGQ